MFCAIHEANMFTKSFIQCWFAGVLVLIAGCGSSPPHRSTAPEDPCDFSHQAKAIWNLDVKTELMLPLKILQETFEAQEAELLTTKLDLFTDDWISMRGSVCRDYAAGRISSDAAYQAKVDCFDSILGIQQTLIDQVRKGDRTVLEQIGDLSKAIETCISSDESNREAIHLNPFDKES